ncbi:osteopetrosis-associated transmembrane protein 1 isoform X2 [Anabrus simplex]
MNARPINLCESCVDQYLNVIETHEKILKLEDEYGEACRKKLIDLDRLEIIEHGYGNVLNLWESGHCSSCFTTNNRTLVISTITVTFNNLHKKTNDCIQYFYNSANKSYDPAVCTSCSEAYCKMNEFYDSLKDTEGDGKICIDIVDSMNTTRSKWSTTLNCGKKKLAPEVPLLLSLMIISLTPVGFYIAAKIFSSKVESRVLRQKRLGHLNYPSTSRLVS